MSVQTEWDAIAAALVPLAQVIPDLNVYGFYHDNPTPPCLDVYPASPFQTGAGMGVTSKAAFFTVRARVSTDDLESASRLLARLLDPFDAASVEQALADTAVVVNDGVSGFEQYADDTGERMIGCQWRVEVFL